MATITGTLDIRYRGGGVVSNGTLFYAGNVSPSPGLTATIKGVAKAEDTLEGAIVPERESVNFPGIIIGIGQGQGDLEDSFIRGTTHSYSDLESKYLSYVKGEEVFPSFVRATREGNRELNSSILAIEPEDISSSIHGVSTETLPSSITAVPPSDLQASIKDRMIDDLLSSIQGYDQSDFSANLVGYTVENINATISGIASSQNPLSAEINASRINRLLCLINGTASEEEDLPSDYLAIGPSDLPSYYLAIPPEDLPAFIRSEQSPVGLNAEILGELGQEHLSATIASTGGSTDLLGNVRGVWETSNDLAAGIHPEGTGDLSALINSDSQDVLPASITSSGPAGKEDLLGNIKAFKTSLLEAAIYPDDPPSLGAGYETIEGDYLRASVYPDIFYIDALIPINTYDFSELSASINSDVCYLKSLSGELNASYTTNFRGDLPGIIVGSNNLVKTVDLLEIKLKTPHVVKDFFKVIIDPPRIATDYLKILVLNVPHGDLTASITGVPASDNITASYDTELIGSFFTSDPSQGILVNPLTGQRKIVRFLFSMTGKTYYYSEVANRTFPENRGDNVKLIIETYDPIDEDNRLSPTMMGEKTNTRRCIVSNLEGFSSWDEAVRYGIKCAAGMFVGLGASINGTGQTTPLRASINPRREDIRGQLPAKISAMDSVPNLEAVIQSSGGSSDLRNTSIFPISSGQTEVPQIDPNLSEVVSPILITFSDENPMIILHKVKSTGNLVIGNNPGLKATITGIAQTDLTVVISGTE